MMRAALIVLNQNTYYIVLACWGNNSDLDIATNSDTISWSQDNQHLLNYVSKVMESQQIQIVLHLVYPNEDGVKNPYTRYDHSKLY